MSRNLIKPSGQILAIEVAKTSMNDDENVLDEVVSVAVRAPEGSYPTPNVLEIRAVNVLEAGRDGRLLGGCRVWLLPRVGRRLRFHTIGKGCYGQNLLRSSSIA
jgi:hypothetical protein